MIVNCKSTKEHQIRRRNPLKLRVQPVQKRNYSLSEGLVKLKMCSFSVCGSLLQNINATLINNQYNVKVKTNHICKPSIKTKPTDIGTRSLTCIVLLQQKGHRCASSQDQRQILLAVVLQLSWSFEPYCQKTDVSWTKQDKAVDLQFIIVFN